MTVPREQFFAIILHEGAVAHAECATLHELTIGDHVVVTGLVEAGCAPKPSDVPIVYFRREYSSAPSSPTNA